MSKSVTEEKRAVDSGYWQLFRFNPTSQTPFTLDSKTPTGDFQEFLSGENRFASLKSSHPERAQVLFEQAENDSKKRVAFYQKLTSFLNDTP